MSCLPSTGSHSLDAPRDELLVNQAGNDVQLTVRRGEDPPFLVTVKALESERRARYRDWVERSAGSSTSRAAVASATSTSPTWARRATPSSTGATWPSTTARPWWWTCAAIGGGSVSALLLEKLARKRSATTFRAGLPPSHTPTRRPAAPVVALTDEQAGSDGDIFSHAFKRLGLGPLVGKRTWGGVIGIWPRHQLADGTITTQPEFSFWFDDLGGTSRTTAWTQISRWTTRPRTMSPGVTPSWNVPWRWRWSCSPNGLHTRPSPRRAAADAPTAPRHAPSWLLPWTDLTPRKRRQARGCSLPWNAPSCQDASLVDASQRATDTTAARVG
ncbi:MAG: hypothetical protein KatS3mg061_3241 [Dehalococcoidia bacterium]|nr:MAG: hypothetical protein KatS3mg061_3241 [Dehalococcoidia bacterium]